MGIRAPLIRVKIILIRQIPQLLQITQIPWIIAMIRSRITYLVMTLVCPIAQIENAVMMAAAEAVVSVRKVLAVNSLNA